MFRTSDLKRQLELARARAALQLHQLCQLTRTVEAQANTIELMTERDDELEEDNRGLNIDLELREQQLAAMMDLVAERNRYTEHIGAMDTSKVTDPQAVLEALVREARELTHEYATSVHVTQRELEFSGY